MKITLHPDGHIEHPYHNEELKDVINAVCMYNFDATYYNFMKIVIHCKPEMLRAAITKDNYAKCTPVHSDILDIAMVYKGYKPICWIEELPDFINQLKLNVITFKKKRKNYIIYKYDAFKSSAESCVEYLKSFKKEDSKHHYIIGGYLGYPEEDIDFFNRERNNTSTTNS
jgi:hypothetical protein